jgi:hypothetical protein
MKRYSFKMVYGGAGVQERLLGQFCFSTTLSREHYPLSIFNPAYEPMNSSNRQIRGLAGGRLGGYLGGRGAPSN